MDAVRRIADGAAERMLVILGASGAGKSSFLRAGILDRMRSEAHARLVTLAGLDPAIQPPRVVIAIDQMDELFNPDNTEGTETLNLIAGVLAQDPMCLAVATIRSAAFERVQNAPELTAIARQLFDLDRLGPDAFRAAIEGPAKLTQPPLKIESELTGRIVKDLAGRDSLPLLAFVMQRLPLAEKFL
jgi:hypothetical protein